MQKAAEKYLTTLFYQANQIAKKNKRKFVIGKDLKEAEAKRIKENREKIARGIEVVDDDDDL